MSPYLRIVRRAGHAAQPQSACLARAKPWVDPQPRANHEKDGEGTAPAFPSLLYPADSV